MSVQIIKEFNKTFEFLLEQLSSYIGTKPLLKFKMLIKYNSLTPLENFIIYALPEKQNILTKNEQFFLSKIDENNLLSLNEIYYQLDKTSKSNLWDLIHALLYLSEDYNNKKNVTSCN